MPAVLTSLPIIAFSKNPVWLKLTSADYLTAAPVKAINSLDISGAVAADNTLTIPWAKGVASLIAKAAPDGSGRQIPTGDGSNAYVTTLMSYLKGNYFIDRDFVLTTDFTGAHPRIVFTARNTGSDYNFSGSVIGSFTIGNITAGVTGAVQSNFMHYLEVWIQNTDHSAYVQAFAAVIPLDMPLTGSTTVDISDILHSFLALDVPNLTGYWNLCPASSRKYFVKYAQFLGDDPAVQSITTSPTSKIIFGGYSNLALGYIANIATYLATYLLPNALLYTFQRWLETWPIDTFTVKTNQPQFLYFINNRTITENLSVRLDLTFSDSSTSTVFLAGGSVEPLQKIAVGCGYLQLGLQAYNNGVISVTGYRVTIVETTTQQARSLVKTFTVDRSHEEFTRYFLYADSAGNFKTLHTYGKAQATANVSADQVEYQPNLNVLPQSGNYANANIRAVVSDKANTGYITGTGTYDAVSELVLSKAVFRVFNTQIVPVVITSTAFDYSADGKNFNAFQLEYRLAFDETQFTGDSYALAIPSISNSQQALNDI